MEQSDNGYHWPELLSESKTSELLDRYHELEEEGKGFIYNLGDHKLLLMTHPWPIVLADGERNSSDQCHYITTKPPNPTPLLPNIQFSGQHLTVHMHKGQPPGTLARQEQITGHSAAGVQHQTWECSFAGVLGLVKYPMVQERCRHGPVLDTEIIWGVELAAHLQSVPW